MGWQRVGHDWVIFTLTFIVLPSTKKRKRVTFGEDLSPEVFDESLPANTPLRKGQTPVRRKDLSSLSPPLLEQSPVPERLPQPDFDDKGENLVSMESVKQTCLWFLHTSPICMSSNCTLKSWSKMNGGLWCKLMHFLARLLPVFSC